MSSSYELCPAIVHDDGYLVIRRVEKAYPVFLRCAAAHFPVYGPATETVLHVAEQCKTLEEFSAATARLVSQPLLRPFEGGIPVLAYVARPGKEELFQEFADGLDQADDYKLLKSLPAGGPPLVLIFGDPSRPLVQPAEVAAIAAIDSTATAVHIRTAAPAAARPITGTIDPEDEVPAWTSAGLPADSLANPAEPAAFPLEPDLRPSPAPERVMPARPSDFNMVPPVDVVMASTSAPDDLLRPSKPDGAGVNLPDSDAKAPGPTVDPLSEPALEVLLRQAPRLQAPDTELGPALRTAPDEVLAAVKHVVTALDEALRRQASEQQTALQSVIVATEQVVQQQGRALEARQAEQWERQQAALRQMHADQAAAIQTTLTRLDEERAAWQQRSLRELLQASSQQLPGALRQMQDELAARQQQALHQLRDDLLSRQPPAPAAAPAPAGEPADLQELNWQLENAAVSTQDMRQRVGQLLWVNVVLILILIGLAFGVFWLLRGNLAPSRAPVATSAATLTLVPATTVPPTPIPPTAVPATPTAAATATTAATALPVFAAALSCANSDRPRNFYECVVTNGAPVTDTLALAVQATGDELNGFHPLVTLEDQRRIEPDPVTGLFSLGALAPGETRPVRVLFPCAVASGCAETTFAITPLVDDGQTIVTDQIVHVTTHYFPPAAL